VTHPGETTSSKSPPVLRREIFGWAMFDFANSSYTTIIVTVAFSIYFTKLVAPGAQADWLWSVGVSISNILVVLTAPVIGAVADDSGRKKLFLALSYLACVSGTAVLYFVLPGQVGLGLALFIFSNVAYSFGENLAGAFLPEISTRDNIGRISGFGWGLGYFGGLASLILIQPLLRPGFTLENLGNLRLVWVLTAMFFLFAGLPTFLFLRERAPKGPKRSLVGYARIGFSRLAATAHALGHFSELARFLAVFFVYSCGLMSVIAFAAIFAERSIGFGPADLIGLFIVLQVSAAIGAVLFGWIQDQLGVKRTVVVTLLLWIAVSIGAYLSQTKTSFWGVALASGLGIGSLQSASRALVGLFSPTSKSGEFFGFWGLSQRAAYAVGPAVFGFISSSTGSQRLAILVNAGFFVAGLLGLGWVNVERGRKAAEAWVDSADS
jgi:UMF1 family MFS transporter